MHFRFVSTKLHDFSSLLEPLAQGRGITGRAQRIPYKSEHAKGQFFPARPKQARLVSSLLWQIYTAYDRFHGNGPHGKIPTQKEPIRAPLSQEYLPI